MRPAEIATLQRELVRTLKATGDWRQLALLIADQRNGYPSGGLDVPGGSSDDTPTERAALTPDRAAEALHDLDRIMRTLQRAMDDLAHMNTHWTAQSKTATCASCGDPSGDRYRTHCRWCTEWVSRHGEFPTAEEIAHKQMGGRPGSRKRRAAAA